MKRRRIELDLSHTSELMEEWEEREWSTLWEINCLFYVGAEVMAVSTRSFILHAVVALTLFASPCARVQRNVAKVDL